jgi:ATP-dependent DNA helicase RecG
MFDDRLEIQSPGGFPPFVTPENIYDNSTPRNRYIMDALYDLDFVQCANEGTKLMRDTMRDAGLPAPIFEQKQISHAQVRVTLQNDVKHRRAYVISDVTDIIGEDKATNLDEFERRIVNYVFEYGRVNVTQARNQGLKDWHTARNRLLKLVERKILIRVGRTDIEKDPMAYFILAKPPARILKPKQ